MRRSRPGSRRGSEGRAARRAIACGYRHAARPECRPSTQSSSRPLRISTLLARGGQSSALRWRSAQSPASSGIEDEIVRRADLLQVLPDVFIPVASIGHLIALKALAGRHQDLTDLGYLISVASDADLDEARASAAMIGERGFSRGQRLSEDLTAIIGQAPEIGLGIGDIACFTPSANRMRCHLEVPGSHLVGCLEGPADSWPWRASDRPITIRWTWLVPSTICSTLASRMSRSAGKSST
jgi:hypothetical protein